MSLQTSLAAGLLLTPTTLAHAQPTTTPQRVPGVTLRVFHVEEDLAKLPALVEGQTPNIDRVRAAIDLDNDPATPAPGFGDLATGNGSALVAQLSGWIIAQQPGDYRFRLTSDDGSRLWIDGKVAAENDGNHGATAVESEPVFLAAGEHALYLEYFDHAGGQRLRLQWQTPGAEAFAAISPEALTTHADETRVTSPGFKLIEGATRPGDGKPLNRIHPMWEVSTFRPATFEPMVGAMCFDAQGRLIVGTFDPLQRDEQNLPDIDSKEPDKLYAVTESSVQVVAEGLLEPCGLVAVGDAIYVSHRRAITRLLDTDADGFYETHQDVATGWEGWNYHQFVFGLVHRPAPRLPNGPDHPGFLYATLSTAMAPPAWEGMGTNATVNGPLRGSVLEVDLSIPDPAQACRVIAGGTRTPNGLGVGPGGTLWYADNQGTWMPTSQFSNVIPGRFYGHHNRTNLVPKLADRFPVGGHPSALADRARTPASILLPHGEISNSPTQSQLIPTGVFAGQMLLGELTAGGIRRVFLEKVNGEYQGAVFRHAQGFEVGVNRMIWGPDGSLYIGGIGADGNWKWKETMHGLHKLTPTGAVAFEMKSIHAQPDGFVIEFTKPVNAEWLMDTSNYEITSWIYEPTAQYGGPKLDEQTHAVTHPSPSDDGTSVRLIVDSLAPGRCVGFRLDPISTQGEPIWSTQAWYTLNAIPRESPITPATLAGEPVTPEGLGVGLLPTEHASVLIGASADGAMKRSNENALNRPVGRSDDEIMALPGSVECGMGTGDLVSAWQFGDVRLHVEWLSPPGGFGQMAGNSGVYLQERYEVQVLGTKAAGEGGPDVPALNEAGAIYNVKTADTNASNGPGHWQAYDLWFRAPRFENGLKTDDARLTVYWNGVLIHDDVPIPGPTGSAAAGGESAADGHDFQIGAIRFQDHGSAAEGPVLYRNVWAEPLSPDKYVPAGEWLDLVRDEKWQPRGGRAPFRVIDGTVIGTSQPDTPNSFLTTERTYADFELLYEVRQDPRLNSGVQVRSAVDGGYDNRDGGLIGYQIELDPSDRAYSGGIYDERRRGWLTPLVDQPYARRAYRPGEWNQFRVLAQGDRIRTWVNGVPAADLLDAMTRTGHIGLQVHGVGPEQEPMKVEWRNVRLRKLVPAESE
ncbi:MAG: hypothetical protein ACI89L_001676 [Phycisphaerales bacterium]|jgi:hypothetical protein